MIPNFRQGDRDIQLVKRVMKNLSHSAVAFNTALYSNDVPKNIEEALRDPK